MSRLVLVILGKQGAGKGTQCAHLAAHYAIPHVSTGDILRAAVKADSPLGREVSAVLEAGGLVSDDLVNRLVAERFAEPDAAGGALLDGYPRTPGQASALDEILGEGGVGLCLNLDIASELAVARLSSRRVCVECGSIYRDTDPEGVSGTCSKCGGDVIQRSDDAPDAIAARLALYERDTAPLLDFYAQRGLLVTIDGARDAELVSRDIIAAVAARGLA